jgi:hypothetical protein
MPAAAGLPGTTWGQRAQGGPARSASALLVPAAGESMAAWPAAAAAAAAAAATARGSAGRPSALCCRATHLTQLTSSSCACSTEYATCHERPEPPSPPPPPLVPSSPPAPPARSNTRILLSPSPVASSPSLLQSRLKMALHSGRPSLGAAPGHRGPGAELRGISRLQAAGQVAPQSPQMLLERQARRPVSARRHAHARGGPAHPGQVPGRACPAQQPPRPCPAPPPALPPPPPHPKPPAPPTCRGSR